MCNAKWLFSMDPFAFINFGCSGCFVNWQKLIRKTYDLNTRQKKAKKNDNVEQNREKNSKNRRKNIGVRRGYGIICIALV